MSQCRKKSSWQSDEHATLLKMSLNSNCIIIFCFWPIPLERYEPSYVLSPVTIVKKLYEKLDTLFLEDINQSAFRAYKIFENYQRPPGTSLEDFLIEFGRLVAKLKDFNILLSEPVLAFRALKSVNITKDNEKLVKATVSELMLSSMSEQLRKIMHRHSSSDTSPNTSPVMVKNEMDIGLCESLRKKGVIKHLSMQSVIVWVLRF